MARKKQPIEPPVGPHPSAAVLQAADLQNGPASPQQSYPFVIHLTRGNGQQEPPVCGAVTSRNSASCMAAHQHPAMCQACLRAWRSVPFVGHGVQVFA